MLKNGFKKKDLECTFKQGKSMKITRLKIIPLLIFFSFFSFGQKQANYWYFGYKAGITFSGGPPAALPLGVLATSEGCSSISDDQGNLLFYTDGSIAYDKKNNVMTHGYGLL